MKIITFTSDFGLKDFYVAAVKGRVLCECPSVNFVDITHQINAYNVLEASYVVESVYSNFPKGTIHILSVDTSLTDKNKYVVVEFDGHYFIGTDNGIFSRILNNSEADKIIQIDDKPSVFPTLDVFANLAASIANGIDISTLGSAKDVLNKFTSVSADYNENEVVGKVIHIDSYGNIITNIDKDLFNDFKKDRDYQVNVRNYKFKRIYKHYTEFVESSGNTGAYEGVRFAVFNSLNLLELGMYRADLENGASTLLGITYGDIVSISYV